MVHPMKYEQLVNETSAKKLLQDHPLLLAAAKFLYGDNVPLTSSLVLKSHLRTIYRSENRCTTTFSQLWCFYEFPEFGRWDYGSRPVGISLLRPFEIYNRNVVFYRSRKRLKPFQTDPDKVLESIRRRMWCVVSCFVFPLLVTDCEVKDLSPHSLQIRNSFGDRFQLIFDPKTNQLLEVSTERFGGFSSLEKRSPFTIKVLKTKQLEAVILPSILKGFWGLQEAIRIRIKSVTIGKLLKPAMFASL